MIRLMMVIIVSMLTLNAQATTKEEASKQDKPNFSGFRELMGIQKNSDMNGAQENKQVNAVEETSSDPSIITPLAMDSVKDNAIDTINKGIQQSFKSSKRKSKTAVGPDVEVDSGINKFLFTSWKQFNRIIIPFNDPIIRTTADKDRIMLIKDANVVYFATDIFKTPVALFISPKNDPTTTISLSLSSLNIEPKEYRVSINGYQAERFVAKSPDQKKKAKAFEDNKQNDYLAWIDSVVKEIGKSGGEPELPGYTPAAVTGEYTCSYQEGIEIAPESRWLGMNYQLLKYRILNTTDMPIEVMEGNCWDKEVVSVTSYPKSVVKAGGDINLFVLRVLNSAKGKKGVGGGFYAR